MGRLDLIDGSTGRAIVIDPAMLDQDKLESIIRKIIIENPDSETIQLAEGYLCQCLTQTLSDPEKNPIIASWFKKIKEDFNELILFETNRLWEDIYRSKRRLEELEAYANELQDKLSHYETELNIILEDLESIKNNL